ncbi:hypothetical protein CEP51_016530 [Fusarium floridanum]|uniref:Uncharacterized protein n=1 Tax=Fusarium floridanum TaxID=1325733 RepID=A0A428NMI0_9HYPO|nr:hypothetical protein CEP51_016530 [Fusarium floridanum]
MSQLPPVEALRAVAPQDITVAIFCALTIEVVAVKFTLDERLTNHESVAGSEVLVYSYGLIGGHNVVIVRGAQMGPVNAATCAATVVQQFPNIRFALMIGIGGGIPSGSQDIRLGDVAVGIPGGSHPGVIQYDFGKYEQDGSFVLKGCLNKPPSVLISACHRLEEDEEETGRRPHCDILKAICERNGRYERPNNDDVLFKDDFRHVNASGDCTECQAAGEEGVVLRKPRYEIDESLVHLGLIMSGGGVVKNSEDRRRLRRGNEDAICFEMEAAGIADQIPCLVIRGICDYADTHKNDDWHRYAAAAAAAYGKAVLTKVTGKEVRTAIRLQDLMKALKTVEGKIGEVGERVDRMRRSNAEQKVLDWLGQESWRYSQDDHFAKCEPGTGKCLLASPQFNEWFTGVKTTLLCQGLPGAGKTLMTSLVIDHLRRTAPEETVVVYAYYDAGKREQQKVAHILASLLRQLVEASPSMPGSVQRLHLKNKGRELSSVSSREFTDALIDAARLFSRVYVVIDALDESDDLSNLLPEIFKMQQAVKTNVFATSRPDKRIEARFNQSLSLEIRASDEDVSLYLDTRIAQHDVIKDEFGEYAAEAKATLRETVKEKIRDVSDGIFLLARFHMDSVLEMTSPNQMRESIKMLPKGPAAYREIYLKTTQRIDNQPEEYCSLAKATLIWLVCAKRPMTVPELREALAIKINASSLNNGDFSTTRSIVEACKGLVSIGNDEIIQLLHHTAREYLDSNFGWLEEPRTRRLSAAEVAERAKAMAHRDITLKLLTYVSFDTFEAGYCDVRGHYLERKASNRLYSYGSRHWVDHLKSSGPYVSKIVDLRTSSLLKRLLGSEKKWRSFIQAFFDYDLRYGITALLGPQLNAQDGYGRTPLSHAAGQGHVDTVVGLLDAGAHVDTGDSNAQTPLAHAAERGYKEVVRCLLEKKADIERKDHTGQTPLALAAAGGRHAVLELLLEEGADIEARDNSDMTPLILAATFGKATAVKFLLEKGAKTETRDRSGRTPLFQAAENGHVNVVRILLDWGVDIEAQGPDQYTPLMAATGNDHISLVKALLQKGCDIEAKTGSGGTALSYAVESDAPKTRSLRDRNHDFNPWLNSDISQLGETAPEEDFKMCQLLLDNKANPNGTGSAADWSPLLKAAVRGQADMIRFLLRAGADPNLGIPIVVSALFGHTEVVRALAIAGAETKPLEPKVLDRTLMPERSSD